MQRYFGILVHAGDTTFLEGAEGRKNLWKVEAHALAEMYRLGSSWEDNAFSVVPVYVRLFTGKSNIRRSRYVVMD